MQEHVLKVKEVLKRLHKSILAASIEKYQFYQASVEFSGYIISKDRIAMFGDKVEVIRSWESPKIEKYIQSFMGFATFYRWFIENCSKIVKSLTDLTKDKFKGEKFKWPDAADRAFKTLKAAFISALILRHFDPRLSMVIETDVSYFAIRVILLPVDNSCLKPVAFHLRKMDKAETNYEIHDKEMLGIISAFKEWRRYLEDDSLKNTVYSDYKNLESFAPIKILNRC
jgi:hypothetical protein